MMTIHFVAASQLGIYLFGEICGRVGFSRSTKIEMLSALLFSRLGSGWKVSGFSVGFIFEAASASCFRIYFTFVCFGTTRRAS